MKTLKQNWMFMLATVLFMLVLAFSAPDATNALPGAVYAVFSIATVITNVGKAIAAGRMIGATPSQAEPNFIGIGVGATGGAGRGALAADTALTTPVESRVAGTSTRVTTTQTNDTYQSVATIPITATRAIDEAGMFDASTSGQMFFSATFAIINLASGDSLQLTCKTQFT